jgi:DNA-binding XRE family transcriptional regulator
MVIDDALRLRVIKAFLGLRAPEMARSIGAHYVTYLEWEKGKQSPSGKYREAISALCRKHGIGFTPSGFPVPMADVFMFRSKEMENAGNSNQ